MHKKRSQKGDVSLPQTPSNSRRWRLSIAASVAVLIGLVGVQFSENQMTAEEQHALAALNKSKETLLIMSKSFNKGTDQIAVLGQFKETKNKIFQININ